MKCGRVKYEAATRAGPRRGFAYGNTIQQVLVRSIVLGTDPFAILVRLLWLLEVNRFLYRVWSVRIIQPPAAVRKCRERSAQSPFVLTLFSPHPVKYCPFRSR